MDAFLKPLWGYDTNRIWRVEAIQATPAPGVSKVVVFVSDKAPNAKVQTTAFFVTPDGKHAIAGDGVVAFGATPFAEPRKLLQARADGASRGAAEQGPDAGGVCRPAVPALQGGAGHDGPAGEGLPERAGGVPELSAGGSHPFAFKAAAYGYCVQKQKNDAFFTYLRRCSTPRPPDAGDRRRDAEECGDQGRTGSGGCRACAATQATKDQVNASIKLAQDVGVDQTPMLAVNGHLLPLAAIPYETLKKIISYQATLDGVSLVRLRRRWEVRFHLRWVSNSVWELCRSRACPALCDLV